MAYSIISCFVLIIAIEAVFGYTAQQTTLLQKGCAAPTTSLCRRPSSGLRMVSAYGGGDTLIGPPPTTPEIGWYGDDDPYIRELENFERKSLLLEWIDMVEKSTSSENFDGSRQVMIGMLQWQTRQVYKYRQFTVAACKGNKVDAVVSLSIEPDVTRFHVSENRIPPVITVRALAVHPSRPRAGAASFLLQKVKEVAHEENVRVVYDPLKDIYNGRFFIAAQAL
eukprot:CAMPEP_0194583824 /NCGR_PEP_ID=MMETSP0292-20121207/16616_1 /TAXON_ID=39354 /ORGANISM="Heterosigma akashiwo, Strain CCMP2393" /LENGTH=223 /DNA_ID=CAMNT_0039438613 /DNA_START=291 /DNA_END=962 /DNA_ORIENTATION=+